MLLLAVLLTSACTGKKIVEPSSLRGLSVEQLQQMRQDILDRAGGKTLSVEETAFVEELRDQERRLDNAWIFGEWRERHGARLIFRDDGSANVGARTGTYDEVGVYKFFATEQPSYETIWSVYYDEAGDPVVLVATPDGDYLVFPFHDSRNRVYERRGSLLESGKTDSSLPRLLIDPAI